MILPGNLHLALADSDDFVGLVVPRRHKGLPSRRRNRLVLLLHRHYQTPRVLDRDRQKTNVSQTENARIGLQLPRAQRSRLDDHLTWRKTGKRLASEPGLEKLLHISNQRTSTGQNDLIDFVIAPALSPKTLSTGVRH